MTYKKGDKAMRAKEIEELKNHIDIVALFNYTGGKVFKEEKGWIGVCPFHAEGTDEMLAICPDTKTFKCTWCI